MASFPRLRDFKIVEDVDIDGFNVDGKTYFIAGLLVTYAVPNRFYSEHELLDYIPFVVPEDVEVSFDKVHSQDISDALHMFSNDPRNVFYNLPPDVRDKIDRRMMKIAEETVTDLERI